MKTDDYYYAVDTMINLKEMRISPTRCIEIVKRRFNVTDEDVKKIISKYILFNN